MQSAPGAPGAEGRPPRGRVSAGAARASARRGAATCAGRGDPGTTPAPAAPRAAPRRRDPRGAACGPSQRPAPRALRVAAAFTLRVPRPGRGAAFPAARCSRYWASRPHARPPQ